MKRAQVVISTCLAVLAGWEAYAIVNKDPGDTISEVTRKAFRVHTAPGAFIFLGLLGGLSSWYAAHIVQRRV